MSHDEDMSLLKSVDLKAFFETVRLRWWVVPAVMLITAGFFVAQETRLSSEPKEYLVSRSYQIPNPVAVLGSVGLNSGAIVEFPDAASQLITLRGEETRLRITAELGKDVAVVVPSTYETPFVLQCRQPMVEDCERAIELYVLRAAEIRREAIISGLMSARAVYSGVDTETQDVTASTRVAAIDALLDNLDTNLVLIDSSNQPLGATVTSVKRTKYSFGFFVGLIVALLILLQLTFTDNRIRSVRQLVRLIGEVSFLGVASRRPDDLADRRTALALYCGLGNTTASRLRFIPLRHALTDETGLDRVLEMTAKESLKSKPFSSMSVTEFADTDPIEADVLVVQQNRDLRSDLSEALAASRLSGRQLIGVLLTV
jgi:hypothetical protein